jgi:HD-GYP domain-containing protein (c-di-GMP phosphodiesterase class II)/DNA-binding CsgD family transcriptional regulator
MRSDVSGSPPVRVADILGALSLTTDLGSGLPFEKGLRTCALASAFAEALDLGLVDRRAVFHASLLRAIGCTAHAPENAAMFADDVMFQRALKVLDPGHPETFAARFGDWAGVRQPALLALVVAKTPTVGVYAARSGCEVSQALGRRLGISTSAILALDQVYERWDGYGIPDGLTGEQLTLPARIAHVAEQAVIAHAEGGESEARHELARRAGGHLDPSLCAAFAEHADALFGVLGHADMLAAVLDAEPPPVAIVDAERLDGLCLALAIFTDLKGIHLVGHSTHVAELAAGAGTLQGMNAETVRDLRAAALLHDVGRAGVSSEIWDRAGPLGPGDVERVRLHPYWTGRILGRCPTLSALVPVAAAHHERLDGSGYHRRPAATELSPAARTLAAADVFAAMTEDRPHRPAFTREDAARALLSEADRGRLDPGAAAAVIEAAGLPRRQAPWPYELTRREVDVLRLCARGLTNREIAERLVLSPRTVQHHLASVYDKTGRRTRAGAAVLAVEHGLLAAE